MTSGLSCIRGLDVRWRLQETEKHQYTDLSSKELCWGCVSRSLPSTLSTAAYTAVVKEAN